MSHRKCPSLIIAQNVILQNNKTLVPLTETSLELEFAGKNSGLPLCPAAGSAFFPAALIAFEVITCFIKTKTQTL